MILCNQNPCNINIFLLELILQLIAIYNKFKKFANITYPEEVAMHTSTVCQKHFTAGPQFAIQKLTMRGLYRAKSLVGCVGFKVIALLIWLKCNTYTMAI